MRRGFRKLLKRRDSERSTSSQHSEASERPGDGSSITHSRVRGFSLSSRATRDSKAEDKAMAVDSLNSRQLGPGHGQVAKAVDDDVVGKDRPISATLSADHHSTSAQPNSFFAVGPIDDTPSKSRPSARQFTTGSFELLSASESIDPLAPVTTTITHPSTDRIPVVAKTPQKADSNKLQAPHSFTISSTLVESPSFPSPTNRPSPIRKQSLLPANEADSIVNTLLESFPSSSRSVPQSDHKRSPGPANSAIGMVDRKIWVKRPGASPTLVKLTEDDLVDSVRDVILRKYANALGRSFDAPDINLRIMPRQQPESEEGEVVHSSGQAERFLAPDESILRTLDRYYPGGQSAEEALIIEVPNYPHRKTPRPSPQQQQYSHSYNNSIPNYVSEYEAPPRAVTEPADYFSVPPHSHSAHSSAHSIPTQALPIAGHAMSMVFPPSPGAAIVAPPSPGQAARTRSHRPSTGRRLHTASPIVPASNGHAQPQGIMLLPKSRSRGASEASNSKEHLPLVSEVNTPAPPALHTPPIITTAPRQPGSPAPPVERTASPRPQKKVAKRKPDSTPQRTASVLDGGVPPINVLIVEDNIINLRLLEAFMKRLQVRWQTAMNGREAVNKWRTGGFHLVLMDIQLPIMSGLEATKEIRRLESVNQIGTYAHSNQSRTDSISAESPTGESSEEISEADRLRLDNVIFKSPVIIVALTASSLQSDRHEALQAGCNDFLTKPVNYNWLEKKVIEWGCMQALIDFDGWRKWKNLNASNDVANSSTVRAGGRPRQRTGLGTVSNAIQEEETPPPLNDGAT